MTLVGRPENRLGLQLYPAHGTVIYGFDFSRTMTLVGRNREKTTGKNLKMTLVGRPENRLGLQLYPAHGTVIYGFDFSRTMTLVGRNREKTSK